VRKVARHEVKVVKHELRDTLLEDYVGRSVTCYLENSVVVGGVLRRVSKYEVEVEGVDSRFILLKHALVYVEVVGGEVG